MLAISASSMHGFNSVTPVAKYCLHIELLLCSYVGKLFMQNQ